MKRLLGLAVSAIALAACDSTAPDTSMQETDTAHMEPASSATERTAGYSEDRNAYFGDLHIHTRSSFDAYIFNVRRTANDAYRFARGETITHPSGFDMSISTQLPTMPNILASFLS